MTRPARLATYFHVHLVSDSTGETLNALARAVCARFTNVLPIEHIYALVRSPRQLERALEEIANAPGVVLHTIIDPALRGALESGCQQLDMPCIPALDPLVSALSRYLGAPLSTRVGAQYALDADYFNRMDALNYAIGHDDGQGGQDLERGRRGAGRASRAPRRRRPASTSPTAASGPPTCRWCRGRDPPQQLRELKRVPIVVGLTVSPDRLIEIRRNRLTSLNEHRESTYVDTDAVRQRDHPGPAAVRDARAGR